MGLIITHKTPIGRRRRERFAIRYLAFMYASGARGESSSGVVPEPSPNPLTMDRTDITMDLSSITFDLLEF